MIHTCTGVAMPGHTCWACVSEEQFTAPAKELQKFRSMPIQKPGLSKQDYQTPPDFMAAIKRRLCIQDFMFDLAADAQNKQAIDYFDKEADALKQNWHGIGQGWLWLNPPFANISPWVEKCAIEAMLGAKIAVLIPASVGADWWKKHVVNNSYQLFLNGRLKFVGCEDYYPKDCALLLYTPYIQSGNCVWDWRK